MLGLSKMVLLLKPAIFCNGQPFTGVVKEFLAIQSCFSQSEVSSNDVILYLSIFNFNLLMFGLYCVFIWYVNLMKKPEFFCTCNLLTLDMFVMSS